jgi:hypothetical protein
MTMRQRIFMHVMQASRLPSALSLYRFLHARSLHVPLARSFEWAALHQGELLTDWALVCAHQPPAPIAPLS